MRSYILTTKGADSTVHITTYLYFTSTVLYGTFLESEGGAPPSFTTLVRDESCSPLSTDMRLLNCTIISKYTCSTIYLPFKRVGKETVSVVCRNYKILSPKYESADDIDESSDYVTRSVIYVLL